MAFLAPLLAAGMSSGIIPGLISKVGGFVSDVLGGIGRGKKLGEAAVEAGGRALSQIAGAPPTQSPTGEALQNMHISNQLPMQVPAHAVNRMQPKETVSRMPGRSSASAKEKLINLYTSLDKPKKVSLIRRFTHSGPNGELVVDAGSMSEDELLRLDDAITDEVRDVTFFDFRSAGGRIKHAFLEEGSEMDSLPWERRAGSGESAHGMMQPRMTMAHRTAQRAPIGALAAPGGFVSRPGSLRRTPTGPVFAPAADEEDSTTFEPPSRARRARPRKMTIEEIDIPVRRPRRALVREEPEPRTAVQRVKTGRRGAPRERLFARVIR